MERRLLRIVFSVFVFFFLSFSIFLSIYSFLLISHFFIFHVSPRPFSIGDGDVLLVVWLRRPPLDVGIVDRAKEYFIILL